MHIYMTLHILACLPLSSNLKHALNGIPFEIKAVSKIDNIEVEQYGRKKFIKGIPSKEDMAVGKAGYLRLYDVLKQNKYDVIIAEEANVAVMCNLFTEKELLALMNIKPENVELIITGRNASQKVIDRADLVTEMREIKHYYKQGVMARVGIEK